MKLSTWAKQQGVCYQTAWRWFRDGQLPDAKQLPSGTIIIEEPKLSSSPEGIAIYARVSSSENKDNLEAQAARLTQYCMAKGYQITYIVKEIASGLNDERPRLEKLLLDDTIKIIVVEHKDRLARFGLNYITKMLEKQGRFVEVVNLAENVENDLMQDFVSIITSFTARLYGKRRSHRKTELIIQELNCNETEEKIN
jgi:predicted site-specific integrase-resolvase